MTAAYLSCRLQDLEKDEDGLSEKVGLCCHPYAFLPDRSLSPIHTYFCEYDYKLS